MTYNITLTSVHNGAQIGFFYQFVDIWLGEEPYRPICMYMNVTCLSQ